MSKVGFAACSMLTLGCVCLLTLSGPFCGGCTGGGCLALGPCASPSLPKSTEFIILLLITVVGGCCRVLRTGRDCSFDGGVGTDSGCTTAFSPRGPRGPRVSSAASTLMGCASTRRGVRGVRGPLAAGDFKLAVVESGMGGDLVLEASAGDIRKVTIDRYFFHRPGASISAA